MGPALADQSPMGISKKSLILLLGIVTCWTSLAYAWPPTFGAEFNFTNRNIFVRHPRGNVTSSPESREAALQMKKIMAAACAERGDCTVEEIEDKYENVSYRVNYTDGWWFQISTDPLVIEIQTKAATLSELKSYRNRMQNDIFGTAAQAGLVPAGRIIKRLWAAGHIHMGVASAFANNARLFRNYFADTANHSELAYGIFAEDADNAPPLAILPQEEQTRARQILDLFDVGKIKQIVPLAKRLLKEVYDVTTTHLGNPQKFQAFNVTRIGNKEFDESEQTVETRGFGPQESADDFIDEVELLQGRLEYLSKLESPIPLDLKDPRKMKPYEKVMRFYEYVTQSGKSFETYRRFIEANPALKPVLPQVLKAPKKCEMTFL